MTSSPARTYRDESIPAHPDVNPDHPMVVFSDHRFCAGASLEVMRMPSVHMHSQIELNLVIEGAMTYWFDGREITISAGRLAIFWGLIPHQVARILEHNGIIINKAKFMRSHRNCECIRYPFSLRTAKVIT